MLRITSIHTVVFHVRDDVQRFHLYTCLAFYKTLLEVCQSQSLNTDTHAFFQNHIHSVHLKPVHHLVSIRQYLHLSQDQTFHRAHQ